MKLKSDFSNSDLSFKSENDRPLKMLRRAILKCENGQDPGENETLKIVRRQILKKASQVVKSRYFILKNGGIFNGCIVERMVWLVSVSRVVNLHYLAPEDLMFVCHARITLRRTTKDPSVLDNYRTDFDGSTTRYSLHDVSEVMRWFIWALLVLT